MRRSTSCRWERGRLARMDRKPAEVTMRAGRPRSQHMLDCLLCDFVNGTDRRVNIVYEDALVMVILAPRQANPGHVLIMPKQHIERLAQMTEETGMHLFRIAHRSRRAIEAAGVKCEGTYLGLADGEGSFQLPHIYMDLVPRFRWDRYYSLAIIDRPYDDPEALLRLLAQDRARLWRGEPLPETNELSSEAIEILAEKIRSSYKEIWG